jgi:lysophospholipase L1-like esterase
VHYGSSISHCEDADSPIGVWPVAVARKLGLDLYNLAMSGCANLEQFAARTIRDLPADLISLKVGINIVNGANHTATTFAPAVHGFIDTIREGNPTAKILVISPICCPAHENNPGPSSTNADGKIEGQQFSETHSWIGELTLRGIRKALEEIVAARALTDPNIFYLDGLKLFNEVEAQSLPDGIHPDAAGYLKIADNFIQKYPRAWLA